ncbi:MAG: hypothetical protein KatS3mg039_0285 [Candidatus Kapaibacterium sp.]|nr:MAG: hypothetical protein KatS3mg039_0285 [Candidatus Kapabacteria bacterium]
MMLLLFAVFSALTIQQAPPELRLLPPRLVLHADSSGFAHGTVQVLNHGGEPVEIRRIVPSCKCAAATVLNNPIYPLEVGRIAVQVNTNAWQDTVGTVELAIETNATAKPVQYAIVVHRQR